MPTVYQQTFTRSESRRQKLSCRLVVSDDYPSLFASGSAPHVNVLRISTIKSDLDVAEGKFAEDEMDIELDYASCRNEADLSAFAFMLEARDREVIRYILIEVDGLPAFRGQVLPQMSAEDYRWYGSEYTITPTPARSWKLSCRAVDVAVVDYDIVELMAAWKADESTAFVAAHVADRPAFSRLGIETGGSTPWPCAVWGSLVEFNVMMRSVADKLAELVGWPGFEIVFEPSPIPLWFTSREYVPFVQRVPLFSGATDYYGPFISATGPERAQYFQPSLGDGEQGFYISYGMFDAVSDRARPVSVQRCKSFVGVIFETARSFRMYPIFRFDEDGKLHVSYKSREGITQDDEGQTKRLYIRDVDSASISMEPVDVDGGSESYVGISSPYAVDGDDVCTWKEGFYDEGPVAPFESGFRASEAYTDADRSNLLLWTVAPTQIQVENSNRVSMSYRTGSTIRDVTMNHITARALFNLYWMPKFRTQPYRHHYLHSGIYIPTTETEYAFSGSNFVPTATTFSSFRPASSLTARVQNADGTFADKRYETLSDYVNDIAAADASFYEAEYELTVPFLSGFKTTPAGAESYHNVSLGAVVSIDGADYVVVGIERDFERVETKLRLHYRERFALELPTGLVQNADTNTPPVPITAPATNVRSVRIYSDISAGDAVAWHTPSAGGEVGIVRAAARAYSYQRIAGIALEGGEVGTDPVYIQIVSSGRCMVPVAGDAQDRLYLRTTDYPEPNLSTEPVETPTTSEYVDQCIAIVLAPGEIDVQLDLPLWYEGYFDPV